MHVSGALRVGERERVAQPPGASGCVHLGGRRAVRADAQAQRARRGVAVGRSEIRLISPPIVSAPRASSGPSPSLTSIAASAVVGNVARSKSPVLRVVERLPVERYARLGRIRSAQRDDRRRAGCAAVGPRQRERRDQRERLHDAVEPLRVQIGARDRPRRHRAVRHRKPPVDGDASDLRAAGRRRAARAARRRCSFRFASTSTSLDA